MIHKFFQSGFPKYCCSLYDYYKSFLHTLSIQMDGEIRERSQLIASLHESTKQFGFCFVFDSPKE